MVKSHWWPGLASFTFYLFFFSFQVKCKQSWNAPGRGKKKKKKKLWVISGENSLRTAGCFHSLPFSYKGESKDLADFSKTFLLQGNNLYSSLRFDGTFLRFNALLAKTFLFFTEVKARLCLLEAQYHQTTYWLPCYGVSAFTGCIEHDGCFSGPRHCSVNHVCTASAAGRSSQCPNWHEGTEML